MVLDPFKELLGSISMFGLYIVQKLLNVDSVVTWVFIDLLNKLYMLFTAYVLLDTLFRRG